MRPDPHQARIHAVQALCQLDVQGEAALSDTDAFLAEAGAGWPTASAGADANDSPIASPTFEKAGHPAFEKVGHPGEATRRYARQLIDLVWQKRHHFRERIQAAGSAWDIERMAMVDRNVIRVALAEWTLGEVPPKVVLNEAIEIAREYGAAESPAFVNGVLDALYKSLPGKERQRLPG